MTTQTKRHGVFEMPKYMQFGSNLELGVDAMDQEHREMVDLLNQLACACGVEPCWPVPVEPRPAPEVRHQRARALLNRLEQAAREHFLSEEAMMSACAYPELEPHRTEHHILLAELRNLLQSIDSGQERIGEAVLRELKLWLLGHLVTSDKAFAEHYRQTRDATLERWSSTRLERSLSS
ncbi:MAG: hypothetical protein C3L24_10960 [Candidatus Sedimenticola endophacoides]|uniref:Hemerythrin-like domain-containing protein n=2 Tax=Candidatus Sedimenticola endophacoides TaxID=2548426 RepID=A0A6N4DMM5_9GAMM|nr:MAG: hypothetical protein C3L24_10960 [Candidatus Sedimenticola endophacoides]